MIFGNSGLPKKRSRRKTSSRRRQSLSIAQLEPRQMLAADLLADLNTFNSWSNAEGFIDVNGTSFFLAQDGVNGVSIWKTDGSDAGTERVKDINPGVEQFVSFNNQLFFSGTLLDGLWTSDGTEAGTVQVVPGADRAISLTPIGSELYFAMDGDIWKTDGTAAGSSIVTSFSFVRGMTEFNGNLIISTSSEVISYDFTTGASTTLATSTGTPGFYSFDGNLVMSLRNSLYITDGTTAGTTFLATVGGLNFGINDLVDLGNGVAVFSTNSQIWSTDGTPAGTQVIANDVDPTGLVVAGGTAYFVGDSSDGDELWKSDGTAVGTQQVIDLNPGSGSSVSADPVVLNDVVYFAGRDGTGASELYTSDGTVAGTTVVAPGVFDLIPGNREVLSVASGNIWLDAREPGQMYRLFKSDGTAAGTQVVSTVGASTQRTDPTDMVQLGNQLLFIGELDPTVGDELYSLAADGSASLVKEIYPGSRRGAVQILHVSSGVAFFEAEDELSGSELWRTDGTEAGTFLLNDITQGSGDSSFFRSLFVDFNGLTYFASEGGVWSTDGTAAGTVLVTNTFDFVRSMTVFDGQLYISGSTSASGNELWTSDGTAAGTQLFVDINPGAASSSPVFVAKLNDELYFVANRPDVGQELFKTDGTVAGTQLVADIRPGTSGASSSWFATLEDRIVFTAADGVTGLEVWVTDGTAAGTSILKDINPSPFGVSPSQLVTFGDEVFFRADDGSASGDALWRTDGTAAGTERFIDINPANDDDINNLTVVDDLLFF